MLYHKSDRLIGLCGKESGGADTPGILSELPRVQTMTQKNKPPTNDDGSTERQTDGEPDLIDNVEDLIEQDPLVSIFGDHPRTRILMALLDEYPRSMNPSNIVEKASISRQSWYRHHEELLETGLIEKVGEAGNSPLYATVDIEEDKRIEWLQKLRDWTGAYERSGRRPTGES